MMLKLTDECPTQAPFEFLLQQSEVTKISASAGTILSNIGDPCHNLIIIQRGLVRVYRPAEDGRSAEAGVSCRTNRWI